MLAARFNRKTRPISSSVPLTDAQILAAAPSILAGDAHASRSERYTCIPTIDVVRALRREGFEPFYAAQTHVRDETRREHAKHMLRLRRANEIGCDVVPEIILLNSHDGTSSYQMLSGTFRFVCCNGLVTGDVIDDVRVRHSGDIVDNVIEGAFSVVKTFERTAAQIELMKSTPLALPQREALAAAALSYRYEVTDLKPAPITESQLLAPRRSGDIASDVWSTMNVIQENMIRGGLVARTDAGRRTRTRAVNSIDQDVRLNRALWVLAGRIAESV